MSFVPMRDSGGGVETKVGRAMKISGPVSELIPAPSLKHKNQ